MAVIPATAEVNRQVCRGIIADGTSVDMVRLKLAQIAQCKLPLIPTSRSCNLVTILHNSASGIMDTYSNIPISTPLLISYFPPFLIVV